MEGGLVWVESDLCHCLVLIFDLVIYFDSNFIHCMK